MREDNLEYLCNALGVTMDEIDDAQAKYLNERSLTFVSGRKEFEKLEVPAWLTINEAMRIYDELKDMLNAELLQMNL